jgi:hypothetical protein
MGHCKYAYFNNLVRWKFDVTFSFMQNDNRFNRPFFKNMEQPVWNFEQEPTDEPLDETGINLRAYFDRMSDEKMQQYDPSWPDEKVTEWDDNFRDDGFLMLLCCERDVDVKEYREVLEECLSYRNRYRERH